MMNTSRSKKKLILGTALWGWGITRPEAFKILERHFENDEIIVDTATNYPINKNPKDFGLAIRWLSEWTSAHPNEQFSLIAKIGSTNNMGETDDGRPILFERHPTLSGCYSILGGKIDNVYDVLEKLEAESFK